MLVKSRVDNVFLPDGLTTLAEKLAEIIANLNTKASKVELENGLNAKAEQVHGEVAEIYSTKEDLAKATEGFATEDRILQMSNSIDSMNSRLGGCSFSIDEEGTPTLIYEEEV